MAESKKADNTEHASQKRKEEQAKLLGENLEYEECLNLYTEILEYKKKQFGAQSSEFTQTCLEVCKIANLHALDLLRRNKVSEAKDWLERSEQLAEGNNRCIAITKNNQACYYKKLGLTRSALIKLEEALELEGDIEDAAFKADTHLNICAVLSQMGRHELAMNHAQSSIITVQARLLMTFLPIKKSDAKGKKDITEDLREEIQDQFKDNISILCVSYHNLAVEQEFLKMYPEAIESYSQARSFALNYLGKEDGIFENLNKTCQTATKELQKNIARNRERQAHRAIHQTDNKKIVSGQRKKTDAPRRALSALRGSGGLARGTPNSVAKRSQGFMNHSRQQSNPNRLIMQKAIQGNIPINDNVIDWTKVELSPGASEFNQNIVKNQGQFGRSIRGSGQQSQKYLHEGGSKKGSQRGGYQMMYNSNVGLVGNQQFSMIRPTGSPAASKKSKGSGLSYNNPSGVLNSTQIPSGQMSMFDNFVGVDPRMQPK